MTEQLFHEYRNLLPNATTKSLLIRSANKDSLLVESRSLAFLAQWLYPGDGVIDVVSAYLAWVNRDNEAYDASIIAMHLLLERQESVGAAGIMLDRLSVAETHLSNMGAIDRSIQAEPSWVENHWQRARALKRAGNLDESIISLRTAQANSLWPLQAASLTPDEVAWSGIITGLLKAPESLQQGWDDLALGETRRRKN